MNVSTTRFGRLACGTKDLVLCPEGLIGFEDLRLWTLLIEQQVVWLQSVEQAEIALPTVSPFSFVDDYEPQIITSELASIGLTSDNRPLILAVLNQHGGDWTVNLRAPLVLNLEQRLGRQIITTNAQSLRHILSCSPGKLRKTA